MLLVKKKKCGLGFLVDLAGVSSPSLSGVLVMELEWRLRFCFWHDMASSHHIMVVPPGCPGLASA